VVPGIKLVLAGHPKNFHGLPELTRTRVLKRCGRALVPPAVTVLSSEYAVHWKSFLGMRVRFASPVVITGLEALGRYVEVRVAAGARQRAPTALTAPGPTVRGIKGEQAALTFWLDDGTTQSYPSRLILGEHKIDAGHPLRAGQKLIDLEG